MCYLYACRITKIITKYCSLRFLNVNGFILSVVRFIVTANVLNVECSTGNVSRCRWEQLASRWAGRITISRASGWNGWAATYWTIFKMWVNRHCAFILNYLFMHLPGNELKFSLMAANDDGIAVKLSLDFPMSAALFWKREFWTSVEVRMCLTIYRKYIFIITHLRNIWKCKYFITK